MLFAGLVLPLGVCAALIPLRSAFPNAGAALIVVSAIIVVGLVVTELSARRRRSHEVADAEADHLALIGTLSAMQAEGATPARVVEWVGSALADLLDLTGCRFAPNPGPLPLPSVEEDDQVVWAGISWDVEQMGFPRDAAELRSRHGGRELRRFVREPGFRVPVSRERRMVANLAGSSLLAQTKA